MDIIVHTAYKFRMLLSCFILLNFLKTNKAVPKYEYWIIIHLYIHQLLSAFADWFSTDYQLPALTLSNKFAFCKLVWLIKRSRCTNSTTLSFKQNESLLLSINSTSLHNQTYSSTRFHSLLILISYLWVPGFYFLTFILF